MGRLHPFNNGTSLRICPAPCFYTLCLLSCPLVNTVLFNWRMANFTIRCPSLAPMNAVTLQLSGWPGSIFPFWIWEIPTRLQSESR
jgi:hypothetical protein